jgi:hypothetical protein
MVDAAGEPGAGGGDVHHRDLPGLSGLAGASVDGGGAAGGGGGVSALDRGGDHGDACGGAETDQWTKVHGHCPAPRGVQPPRADVTWAYDPTRDQGVLMTAY